MPALIYRITPLTYALMAVSLILLGLSIATITLQSRVASVFRDLMVQRPGSNLVEWAFVSLAPPNLDTGPGISIMVTGVCGIVGGLGAMGWVIGVWAGARESKVKLVGLTTTFILILSTGASIAVMTYVLINQASQTLPEKFGDWSTVSFTQEYYLCTAFPSLIPDAEKDVYGFDACEDAKSARYLLIGVTISSILLAGLAAIQAWKTGVVAMLMHPDQTRDVEKRPAATPSLTSARIQSPSEVHIPEMVRGPRETRQGIEGMPLMAPVPTAWDYGQEANENEYPPDRKQHVRSSIYGYYSRL